MLSNPGQIIFTPWERWRPRRLLLMSALFYWHREAKSANAEVHYVIQVDQNILPIEVKSGSSGKLIAIKLFREEKRASQIIRVHANLMENSSEENNHITSIPLYMSSRIAEWVKRD